MDSQRVRTSKAVVLAAGSGTRIQPTFAGPKPLLPVAGVPIVVRTLRALVANGVTQVAVIVGYHAEEVRPAVERWAATQQISLTCIQNDRWREPNGLSVKAAQPFTGGDDFVLCMCDHLLDPGIIGVLLRDRERVTALAIDEKVDAVLDFDDATKVRCDEDHRIVAIGKDLVPCDAIDCGAFVCAAEVYEALDRAFDRGQFSISAGMQDLADRRRLAGVPIGDLCWQDIDTPEMFRAAEEMAARLDQGSA